MPQLEAVDVFVAKIDCPFDGRVILILAIRQVGVEGRLLFIVRTPPKSCLAGGRDAPTP